MGVTERFEGLPVSVNNGRGDVDVGSLGLGCQTRSGGDGGYNGDGDRIADEGGERSTKETGGHYEGVAEGSW